MSARSRSLLALAIVIAAACGGAAYASRVTADSSLARPVVALDLSAIVGGSDPDRRVVETAYEQVEHSYYQAVDPQRLIDGETKALTAYLTAKKISGSNITRPRATG